jgi:IclR family transcriptional regulator, acetate operon repressor
LRDICQQTKINKTTAYRFVSHLEREGYLFRDSAGRYSFAMKLLHLAAHIDPHVAFREMARRNRVCAWSFYLNFAPQMVACLRRP